MIDRILKNATIYTLDAANPRASALAISGERIVALGSDDDILPLAKSGTAIDDANRRIIIPGLVDAHIHWENTVKAHHFVDLWQVPSKAEALRRIAAGMKNLGRGEWIAGSGWVQELWEDTGRAFPTRYDLDAVTGDAPAIFFAKSGHAAWVNSVALRIAGIDSRTTDPPGGRISRMADGTPDGILLESPAMDLVADHRPPTPLDRLVDWMAEAQQDAWRSGLTGIHDFDNPSCMIALQLLRERGELGLRVLKQINDPYIEHAHALGIRFGFGDDWIRLGALKIFADGALGPKTAAMIDPYEGEPDNYGVVVMDKETIYELVSKASRLGLPSTVHAIGDKAVHDVLDVFEAVRKEEAEAGIPRHARRHRIEHVQIIHPDDAHRLGELDIIASMQPIHAASDWKMAERYWGKRARYSYNWRIQLEAGARLAFGSDSPIDPYDPIRGIYTAVTRLDSEGQPEGGWYPEARLTVQEALEAYTLGAAYASGTEDHSGKLAAGYLADMVMLDRDPFGIAPDEIHDLKVMGTMVGGVWRYRDFD
jgi:hypothetical protein